jgi:translation elongation factor EF-1beta
MSLAKDLKNTVSINEDNDYSVELISKSLANLTEIRELSQGKQVSAREALNRINVLAVMGIDALMNAGSQVEHAEVSFGLTMLELTVLKGKIEKFEQEISDLDRENIYLQKDIENLEGIIAALERA